MLLALLLAQVLPANPEGPIFTNPATLNRYAFFEAFPASGAGTTTACSTTPPTGAKGETLAFTRTGNATCLKQGPATTGIANGDLVLLSTDVPRVSSVAGLLSFLRESARTNSMPRSEALDNAAWTKNGVGVAVATVTGDYATAPDNATTADRVQVAACPTVGNRSDVIQGVAGVGTTYTGSFFLRSVSGTQTVSICSFGGAGGACTPVVLTDASWTRPSASFLGSATTYLAVGCINDAAYAGASNTGAADILVWGAQLEQGPWLSSYIPTTSAAVVRNADSAMSATLASSVGTSFSLGASTAYLSSSVTTATAAQLGTAAPNLASVGRNSNTAAAFTINATSTTPAVSAQGTSMLRGCLVDAAGTRTAWWDGSTVSAPAASMSAGVTALSFGALDAYTARVLVDPSPTRCP